MSVDIIYFLWNHNFNKLMKTGISLYFIVALYNMTLTVLGKLPMKSNKITLFVYQIFLFKSHSRYPTLVLSRYVTFWFKK